MMLIVYRKQIIACFLLVSITFESLVFVQYLAGALALILFSENPPTSRRKFGLQGKPPTWISQCLAQMIATLLKLWPVKCIVKRIYFLPLDVFIYKIKKSIVREVENIRIAILTYIK